MSMENDDVFVKMISHDPQKRLNTIKCYVEGVKSDFPETTTWMNNILLLAGFDPSTGEPFVGK